MATKAALKLGDYVVTEAGFGADLGAEKFLDIKCRKAGLSPKAVVIVATVRALKMHGGSPKDELGTESVSAVEAGCENLARHLENLAKFNIPAVVAINRFVTDTDAEVAKVAEVAAGLGATAIEATHWADGGAGTEELARHVVGLVESGEADYAPLYPDDMPLEAKIRKIAQEIYRAKDISFDAKVAQQFKDLAAMGADSYPICIAKTQYSFSTDPKALGAPSDHIVPIRELRLSNGAEFVVVVTGDIMTMPGLPRVPSAEKIHLDQDGLIQGLF